MAPAIEAHRLTRRFGARTAVEDLDLEVARGEAFVLLGPNGAGKTTTVRVLCCLLAPSAGSARVLGHDVAREADSIRGRIGLLTEAPGLYDRLSAWQVLLFFARLHGLPDAARRVEEHLRTFDLWEHRDVPSAALSKGMKQKVALARTLLHDPEVLFLDEPTAGLDPATQRTVRELLQSLKAKGRTLFVTTHNLDEAERVADRIGVLSRRLLAADRPAALRRRLRAAVVQVAFDGDAAPWQGVAAAVPGVTAARLEDGVLAVEARAGHDLTPDLVAALVAAGARIRRVAEDAPKLKQVYLRLIGEDVGGAAAGVAAGEATAP
jgi:ABC-2 type transport system ATP-binding protein